MTKQIELRPEILYFATQMELQLRANDNKAGWKDSEREFLMDRLYSNAHEVYAGLKSYGACFDAERVIRKAANVANFAMMIADNARAELKEESK